MRFRLASFVLGCALSILGLSLAFAQPKLKPRGGGDQPQTNQPQTNQPQGGATIDRLTPDTTIGLLKQAGYTDLEVYSDNSGNKHVKGKINGQSIAVLHYCEKGTCQFISFVAPLGKQEGVDLNWVNSWNYDKLFAKLSQDKDGNVFFQMECYLFGGVSPNHVVSAGQLFAELIKVLYQYKPS
jgi:hypothetical protein